MNTPNTKQQELEELQLICQDIALVAETAMWRVIHARTGKLPTDSCLRMNVLAEAEDPLTRESLHADLQAEIDRLLNH